MLAVPVATLSGPAAPFVLCSLLSEESATQRAYEEAFGRADALAIGVAEMADMQLVKREVILYFTGAPVALLAAREACEHHHVELRVFFPDRDEERFRELDTQFPWLSRLDRPRR